MKGKIILIVLTGLIMLSSCATSNGHCEAYGNKSSSVDNNEEVNS